MAGSGSGSFSLEGIEKIIPALGDLFSLVWEKSPTLGSFVIIMIMIFPFYLVYALLVARKPEKEIDRKVLESRKDSKKRLKGSSPGGKKQ